MIIYYRQVSSLHFTWIIHKLLVLWVQWHQRQYNIQDGVKPVSCTSAQSSGEATWLFSIHPWHSSTDLLARKGNEESSTVLFKSWFQIELTQRLCDIKQFINHLKSKWHTFSEVHSVVKFWLAKQISNKNVTLNFDLALIQIATEKFQIAYYKNFTR